MNDQPDNIRAFRAGAQGLFAINGLRGLGNIPGLVAGTYGEMSDDGHQLLLCTILCGSVMVSAALGTQAVAGSNGDAAPRRGGATDRRLSAGPIHDDDASGRLSSTAAAQQLAPATTSALAARQTKRCDRSCIWSAAEPSDTLRWHELRPRAIP